MPTNSVPHSVSHLYIMHTNQSSHNLFGVRRRRAPASRPRLCVTAVSIWSLTPLLDINNSQKNAPAYLRRKVEGKASNCDAQKKEPCCQSKGEMTRKPVKREIEHPQKRQNKIASRLTQDIRRNNNADSLTRQTKRNLPLYWSLRLVCVGRPSFSGCRWHHRP